MVSAAIFCTYKDSCVFSMMMIACNLKQSSYLINGIRRIEDYIDRKEIQWGIAKDAIPPYYFLNYQHTKKQW